MPSRSQAHMVRTGRLPSSGVKPNTGVDVTVAVPLVDQTSTTGVADTYTFAAGTFTTPAQAMPLTYRTSMLPIGVTFTAGTRTFNWTKLTGIFYITVFARNTYGQENADEFKVTVT